MEGGEEDPFAFPIEICEPTPSQELKLQTCPFARQFETFPDDSDSLDSDCSPSPSESPPQAILMLSISDSEDDSPVAPLENEEFVTPPEEHNFSSPSSSQEDAQRNLRPVPEVGEEVRTERVTVDDECREDKPGPENLGFTESAAMASGENRVLGGDCLERDDSIVVGSKNFEVSEGECGEPALKKIRVTEENSDFIMPTRNVKGAQITEKADEQDEFIDSDIESSDEDKSLIELDLAEEESEDNEVRNSSGKEIPDYEKYRESLVEKFQDGGPQGEEEGLPDNMSCKKVFSHMNRQDIDVFKYNGDCSNSGDNGDQCWKEVVRRRRQLPPSMVEKGYDNRGGKRDIGNVDLKNASSKELLEAFAVLLKKNVDHGSGDVDFLETAKRRGMTFPRPRWL